MTPSAGTTTRQRRGSSAAEKLRAAAEQAAAGGDSPTSVRATIRAASERMSVRMAAYSPQEQAAVQYLIRQRHAHDWLQSALREEDPLPERLHDALKSGVVLCRLANLMFPDEEPIAYNTTYSRVHAAFKERENISLFLQRCRSRGLNAASMFDTNDLYDGRNMVKVFSCLHALAVHEDSSLAASDSAVTSWSEVAASAPAAEFTPDEIAQAVEDLTEEAVASSLSLPVASPSPSASPSPVVERVSADAKDADAKEVDAKDADAKDADAKEDSSDEGLSDADGDRDDEGEQVRLSSLSAAAVNSARCLQCGLHVRECDIESHANSCAAADPLDDEEEAEAVASCRLS